jgi:disulfide bond formation protein DsbB
MQRAAMLGVATGQLFNFRFGERMSHHAISLFYCIIGGAVSLRQISLHICPDFPTFGTRVLGFELYTWSFIVFVCATITIGVLMFLYHSKQASSSKFFKNLERFAFFYVLLIILADLVVTAMICGIKPCPDNP